MPIQIGGLAPGEEAEITVAAVDVGILNLTGYKTPDPRSYFFGQRKLAVDIRDLYGMLIDGMEGVAGALQTGGDSSGNLEGNLPTQPPLALFSGVVKVGADGAADVAFDMPAFNGSVRVMAVAWSKSEGRLGRGRRDRARPRRRHGDLAALPRSRRPLAGPCRHRQCRGRSGRLPARSRHPRPADRRRRRFEPDGEARRPSAREPSPIPIAAAGVGTATLDLKLTGPGLSLTQRFPLGVAAGAPDVYRRVIKPLAAGQSATIADDLVADFVPGTGSVSVAASPFGALDAPALLQALDRYPYGCSEQTVSRAMPLLYANQIAALEHLADRPRSRRAHQAGDRPRNDAAERQRRVRPVGGRHRQRRSLARRLRHRLPHPRARTRLSPCRRPASTSRSTICAIRVVNAADPGEGAGEPLAYALYVLARNGRPVIGDLRYLADAKLGGVHDADGARRSSPRRWRCSATARAPARCFAAALDALEAEQDNGLSRPDYGSTLRDAAAMLALVAEADLTSANCPATRSPAPAPCSNAPAPRASPPAPRRTTGWRSPPRRSPSRRR